MSSHTPGPWCARLKQTSFGNSGAWIIERDTDADVRTMVCERIIPGTSDADLRAHLEELVGSGSRAA